jgi:hypothetical protein
MQMIGTPEKIVHKENAVTIVHARIVPLIGVGLLVCGDAAAVALSFWRPVQYPQIRRALVAAGFDIKDVKTWISPGDHMARVYTRSRRSLAESRS